jgi:hypothetical protein
MYIHKILEAEYQLKSENLTILFVTGGKAIMSTKNLRKNMLAYNISYSSTDTEYHSGCSRKLK